VINFCNHSSSLDFKMKVITMVNELNANNKVGTVLLTISDDNQIDQHIMDNIINNYNNVYCININDYGDSIDEIHNQIKKLTE